jgi:hypothetical protein
MVDSFQKRNLIKDLKYWFCQYNDGKWLANKEPHMQSSQEFGSTNFALNNLLIFSNWTCKWVYKASTYLSKYYWRETGSTNPWNGFVGFEVFAAMTMKNAVLWNLTPCGSCKNRCFVRKHRLGSGFFYPEDGCDSYSETSVFRRPTERHITEIGILHYLASYMRTATVYN